MNEWTSSELMIFEWFITYIIIKLKNINTNEMSDDVSIMLISLWMSNEQWNLDDTILLNLIFMSRLGRHELEKWLYQEGRPFRGLPSC